MHVCHLLLDACHSLLDACLPLDAAHAHGAEGEGEEAEEDFAIGEKLDLSDAVSLLRLHTTVSVCRQ